MGWLAKLKYLFFYSYKKEKTELMETVAKRRREQDRRIRELERKASMNHDDSWFLDYVKVKTDTVRQRSNEECKDNG